MRNKVFQEILDEKNISIKQASKILNISPIALKDFRDGYALISDEKAIYIANKFNVDPNRFLVDELNYPVPLEVENSKNHVIDSLKKVFTSFRTLFISFLLIVISSISVTFSHYSIINIESDPLSHYNQEFISLYNKIKDEDDLALMPFLQGLYYPTAYQHEVDFLDDTNVKILIATDINQVDLFSYRYKGKNGEKLDVLSMAEDDTFLIDYKHKFGDISYNLLCDYTKEGEFKNIEITNLRTLEELKEDDSLFASIKDKFLIDFNDLENKITNILNSNFNINLSFKEFSTNYIKDMSSINFTRDGYYLMLILFSILLFLAGASIIFTSLWMLFKHYKIGMIDEAFKEDNFEGFDIKTNSTLSKNFKFGPFLKSGILRFLSLFLLFIGNSSLLTLFLSLANPDLMDSLNTIHYQTLFNAFKFISTFLLTFILMDLTRKNKNMPLKVIGLLIGGIAFYIFEIITINYLTASGLVNTLIAEFMPPNILWSTGIYTFLAVFLFTTPKFCNKRWKVIAYRSASLIPLAFLLTSELLNLYSDLGYITISKYLHGLLIHKSYGLSIFIILYIYLFYIYDLYLKSKYKKDEYLTYAQGNVYSWNKNLIASISLLISYLLIYAFSFTNDSFLKDFNNIKYVLVLIPILLLYRPRIPKDNIIQNICYMTGVMVSNVFPYIICYLMLL